MTKRALSLNCALMYVTAIANIKLSFLNLKAESSPLPDRHKHKIIFSLFMEHADSRYNIRVRDSGRASSIFFFNLKKKKNLRSFVVFCRAG